MQYYLYRHIRLDTNQVFYIGISKKGPKSRIKGFNSEYSRAFEKAKRSDYWKNIVNKTEYKVEIIMETDDKDFLCKKEKEFITLYGRACLNQGTLVNFSEGGEFSIGPKRRHVRITQMDLNNNVIKIWEELSYINKDLGYHSTNIVKCCRKKQVTAYGFKWKYTDKTEYDSLWASAARINRLKIGDHHVKTGIKVFDTISQKEYIFRTHGEVADMFRYHRITIVKYLRGTLKHKYLIFSYLTQQEREELGLTIKRSTNA